MSDKKYFANDLDETTKEQIVKVLRECRDLLTEMTDKQIKNSVYRNPNRFIYATLSEVKQALKLLGVV